MQLVDGRRSPFSFALDSIRKISNAYVIAFPHMALLLGSVRVERDVVECRLSLVY